ncbi:hypothetical protein [Pelagibacterium halotolerans]|uniref:hypothetical protein n=1 Tax=Pelagibacterium halotolerans TaxID=531813 RepID=UPI00384F38B9
MRDFIRLLLLGVMSFLVIGGVIVYSRDGNFSAITTPVYRTLAAYLPPVAGAQGTDTAANSTVLQASAAPAVQPSVPVQHEASGAAYAETADAISYTLTIPRPRADTWVGLAGFPDRTQVRFPLPSGLDAQQGELNLTIRSDIADGGDGRLSVAVNGRPRGEIVLNEGIAEHKIDIAVERGDLLGAYLEVELAANGTTTGGQICPTSAVNSGAAITLAEQSVLTVETASPVEGGDVIVATMQQPFNVHLGETEMEQARAIGLAHYLSRRGIDTVFSEGDRTPALELVPEADEPLTTRDGDVVLAGGAAGLRRIAALRASLPETVGWPAFAADFDVTTTEVDFRGKRHWRLQYDLAALENGMMPERLDVALKTGPLTPGSDWLVHVSLNGHLLESRRLDGQADVERWSVALPSSLQYISNALDIELVDTSSSDDVCEARLSVKAQLLPETRLVIADQQPERGWARLIRTIANAGSVVFEVDSLLNASQAMRATAMLSQFVPARTDMRFGQGDGMDGVRLSVFTVAEFRQVLDFASRVSRSGSGKTGGLWLALPGAAVDDDVLSLHDAGEEDLTPLLDRLGPQDVVVAIWT